MLSQTLGSSTKRYNLNEIFDIASPPCLLACLWLSIEGTTTTSPMAPLMCSDVAEQSSPCHESPVADVADVRHTPSWSVLCLGFKVAWVNVACLKSPPPSQLPPPLPLPLPQPPPPQQQHPSLPSLVPLHNAHYLFSS
ncbi:hypothetical protein E2C01_074032 [Portunus trituberculatus]|uniref:Uncharacterized protein n=1 Tax=Portunus trituberculatus TaxID=210409 RepID=A0A5B7IB40_PORTR|nr:hypothetical protein [Portunus trituberculatus]